MSRKKWTPQEGEEDTLFQFREKRKWQIALRRYVLEKQKSTAYAPYFGLDNEMFRQWIELQFTGDQTWDNFSIAWQFDHVVPVSFFNLSLEKERRLCWNFTNIRIASLGKAKEDEKGVDILGARQFFETLYRHSQYPLCAAMVQKISRLEEAQDLKGEELAAFLTENRDYLQAVETFSSEDFERLNTGTALGVILSEKEFLKKFGG